MHWQGIGFSDSAGILNTLVDVFNTEFNTVIIHKFCNTSIPRIIMLYILSNSPLFGLFLVIGFIIIKQEINENGNFFLSVTFVNGWN